MLSRLTNRSFKIKLIKKRGKNKKKKIVKNERKKKRKKPLN